MDDPFGDPFADTGAASTSKPVVKKSTTKPAVASPPPTAASSTKKSVVDDPFSFNNDDSTVSSSSSSSVGNVESSSGSSPKAEAKVDQPVDQQQVATQPTVDELAESTANLSTSADDTPAILDESTAADEQPSSSYAASTATAAVSSSTSSLASLAASYVDLDDDTPADELSLEGEGLTDFPEDLIRTKGAELRRLDLTSNKLTTLKSLAWPYGAPAWPKLEELILDKNQLEGVKGLPQIPSLKTLWMNNNQISDLDTLLDNVEKFFPNLAYLSLLRNPASPDVYFSENETEAYGRFRLYVIYRLRQLQYLDSTEVTPEERKEATIRGAYCRVAKPTMAKSKSPGPESSQADTPTQRQSQVGFDRNQQKPPKVATFLAKGKPRYDGTNSEGNRFIMNDDL